MCFTSPVKFGVLFECFIIELNIFELNAYLKIMFSLELQINTLVHSAAGGFSSGLLESKIFRAKRNNS